MVIGAWLKEYHITFVTTAIATDTRMISLLSSTISTSGIHTELLNELQVANSVFDNTRLCSDI